jgi:hypothetical protein
MTEESPQKYKMKKIIDGGIIKYKKVPYSVEDELAAKELEIKNLHILIDQLRARIETLEAEQARYQLKDGPVDVASSYRIYG